MALLFSLLRIASPTLWACPFCFGTIDPNSGLSRGIFYGIVLLISSTFFILTWLTVAIIRMEKHKTASESKTR